MMKITNCWKSVHYLLFPYANYSKNVFINNCGYSFNYVPSIQFLNQIKIRFFISYKGNEKLAVSKERSEISRNREISDSNETKQTISVPLNKKKDNTSNKFSLHTEGQKQPLDENQSKNTTSKKETSKKKETKKKGKTNKEKPEIKESKRTNISRKKKEHTKKETVNAKEFPSTTYPFNKEEYFKEFQLKGEKYSFIITKIKNVEEIKSFVTSNLPKLQFENIHAHNNFIYEIYDKFSNSEVNKVKKLIKNYTRMTKLNIKKKIKYFKHFYELCPIDYKEVLPCLFIQCVDLLQEQDIRNIFNFDHILIADSISTSSDVKSNNALTEISSAETQEKKSSFECSEKSEGLSKPLSLHKKEHNKNIHELDVRINKRNGESSRSNENHFVIVYDLPVLGREDLVEAIRETFSFCGPIRNIEIFDERVKTVDMKLVNETNEEGRNAEIKVRKNSKKNKKKLVKSKESSKGFALKKHTQLYGIIEFEKEEGANLATNDYIRIFGIFCYNRFVYVDKCIHKKIMIITHLPFHMNLWYILHVLANASVYQRKDSSEYSGTSKKEEESSSPIECTFISLKNQMKIESCSSLFPSVTSEEQDSYEMICAVANKQFKLFKDQALRKEKTVMNIVDKEIKEGKGETYNDLSSEYESFLNFYQNKNKELRNTSEHTHNNERILLLRFDSFFNLLECLKKFRMIFKNKNCMKFSMNLKRCTYKDGEIQDHLFIKNTIPRIS